MTWRWLPKSTILGIHERSIANFGGAAGIRDVGMLESAIARAENLNSYGEPSVFELGAAYGFGLIRNHAFVDGNKRTAFLATILFLELNGFRLTANEVDATVMTLAFAAGDVSEKEFARWLQQQSVAI